MPKGVHDRTEQKDYKKGERLKMIKVRNSKRNEYDKEADDWYMVRRVADGATYEVIAKELEAKNPKYKYTRYDVRKAVNDALVEWKRENIENIDAYIAKDLLRIEEIEKKVMENFELSKRSMRPAEYAVLMKRGMSMDEIDEEMSTRPMAGDPRYLDTLLRLQMQRMRLLGIDKGTDVQQQTIVNYQFNGIGDDALGKMADMLQDSKYDEIIDEQNG